MGSMAKWENVCNLEDLPAGQQKSFPLGALDILVVNTGKRFYACSNECPAGGESLENAKVCGHVLTCTTHGCKMDLSSGKCITDAEMELPVFPVEVRASAIWVKF